MVCPVSEFGVDLPRLLLIGLLGFGEGVIVLYGMGWFCCSRNGVGEGSLLSVLYCCQISHEVARDKRLCCALYTLQFLDL